MIVEFRVANFRSFDEEQTLSLVASADAGHPNNLIHCEDINLLKTTAMFGANASGKSNLIRAIGFVENFVRISATAMNQGDKIPGLVPFRLHGEGPQRPSSFAIIIVVNGVRYEYGFTATVDRVFDEWLFAFPPPHHKCQRWLERKGADKSKWVFRRTLKREEQLLRDKTRDNGLILSRGAELNIKELSDVFLWFKNSLSVHDLSKPTTDLMNKTAKRVMSDELFRQRVVKMLRDADLGIADLRVSKSRLRFPDPELLRDFFIKSQQAGVKSITIDEDVLSRAVIHTIHIASGAGAPAIFNMESDESNGTQRFFALASPFLDALDNGSALVVDELECSMHPILTRALIELFQSAEANQKGAQLICATHELSIFDQNFMRRDQLWIIEKNNNGATFIRSLYDYTPDSPRPRTSEALQRNYTSGKYGGVPQFGPTFEDSEI